MIADLSSHIVLKKLSVSRVQDFVVMESDVPLRLSSVTAFVAVALKADARSTPFFEHCP